MPGRTDGGHHHEKTRQKGLITLTTPREYSGNTPPSAPVVESWEAWPFYIVCDVSSSMHADNFAKYWGSETEKTSDSETEKTSPTSPWRLMHQLISKVVDELGEDEDVRQQVHLAVIQFADRAETILKLTRLDQIISVENFSKGVFTDFAAVWRHLARIIPEDQKRLASTGFKSERPTIFFITDGNPDIGSRKQTVNDWKQHVYDMRRAIGDEERYPRIIAIGLGGMSNENVLLELHSKSPHGAAVIANDINKVSIIVKAVIEQIKKSITYSVLRGNFTWDVPEGMKNLCNLTAH